MNTASLTPFNGSDYDHNRDAPRLTEQIQRVFTVLSDRNWHALSHIAMLTGDPEASISAQIRHLRKARFGGWEIEKKHMGNGLYLYRLTGERLEPTTQPPSDLIPLPPAAPELLEIARKELGQLKGELEAERAKTAALTSALESVIRTQPAGTSTGDLFYEHFDGEGNYLGSEPVDPMSVIQAMVQWAEEGLAAARLGPQIDPQISTETS